MDLAAQKAWRLSLELCTKQQRIDSVAAVEPIMMAGKSATVLAAPVFLTSDTMASFTAAAQSLVDATVAIESDGSFVAGNVLYDRLYRSLSIKGKLLIDRSQPVDPAVIARRFRRLDGYVTAAGEPAFIEMNQSAPLAISFYQRARQLSQILGGHTGGQLGVSADLYKDLAQWFIRELQQVSDKKTWSVAVSMERGYPAKFVDLPVACDGIAAAARNLGYAINFLLAEPTAFRYENGTATVNGRTFDLLWRNTVYLQNYDEVLPEYESIRYGDTPMVNDLQSWLFRSKEFFAMIWDDSLIKKFDDIGVDSVALRAVVPKSISIRDMDATQNRTKWILKRCDDGFGRGIVFGSDCSEQAWRDYCSGQFGDDWIAQRLVDPMTVELPVIDNNGTIHDLEFICDFNPYVVAGVVSGILVRALPARGSVSRKMNIVEGAAIGFAAHV